ncbi:MAG: hypothetical protein U0M02_04025 [Acutalibacteraceae bacterium]|nr:hypothetical protein [Acutalibacteraceae bacterium]
MFSRIAAFIVCIISVFTAPFSQIFSKTELKAELAKGGYESPYIVRPLEEITVNGVSVDEYCVVNADGTLYSNAAETLGNEIYKACGKNIDTEISSGKAFIVNETLNDDDTFSIKVKNGNVYITGSKSAGISRGITAFADEVLLKSQGTYDFKDGYEYTKTFSDYVTYENFGAAGDGKADDLEAIVKTHEYANANGLSVFANETATYYIGGANKTAVIMTDTDWSTACFIIDDTDVENRSGWIFNVAPSKGTVNITDKVSPLKIDAVNIGTDLSGKSLVVLTDSNVKRYIRKGANQNSGSNQTDVILVDENGNISPETPLIWDFDSVTSAVAYPVDTQTLIVKGGRFTTLANNAASEYNYYARGVLVRRSNTVIDGLYHDIKNEGKTGAPYSAFVSLSCCADVTVKNCTFTGHKKYVTTGSAGTSVTMGTYDIGAATAVNAKFINCNQTNDITDIDYWGIAGTNYCKNLVYDGCALSRFDAHQGVLNATVINSVLGHHGIKLIGSGRALIENTTVLAEDFVDLRADYGSTWNGELIIRNCKFYPTGIASHIINAENSEDHDFGYTCYLPEKIEIDGFYVHRMGYNFLFTKVNPKHNSDSYNAEYPVVPTREITVKDFNCLLFGKLSVSKNKAIFKVEITK